MYDLRSRAVGEVWNARSMLPQRRLSYMPRISIANGYLKANHLNRNIENSHERLTIPLNAGLEISPVFFAHSFQQLLGFACVYKTCSVDAKVSEITVDFPIVMELFDSLH